jgi:preprotein translocase subunit SecG
MDRYLLTIPIQIAISLPGGVLFEDQGDRGLSAAEGGERCVI